MPESVDPKSILLLQYSNLRVIIIRSSIGIIRSVTVCTVDPGVPPERGAHLDRGVATPRSRCREVRHSSREFLKENPDDCVSISTHRSRCFDTSIEVFWERFVGALALKNNVS